MVVDYAVRVAFVVFAVPLTIPHFGARLAVEDIPGMLACGRHGAFTTAQGLAGVDVEAEAGLLWARGQLQRR